VTVYETPEFALGTLAVSSLYRMMAQRSGWEYTHSQAKTVFRSLLDSPLAR
jgi:hypothetical protein